MVYTKSGASGTYISGAVAHFHSWRHTHTHPVIGMSSVINEQPHGCMFGLAGGVHALWWTGGDMVENEPESCFLQDHTHTHTEILHVHGDGINGHPNDTKHIENELTAVYKKIHV